MALDFVAGCLGGCAGVIVGHPLDTVKICLQTQDARNPRYKGTVDCIRSILARDGVKGVYRGVSSPLAGVAGINAIVFGIYGNTQRCMSDPDSLKTITLAGTIAGLCQSFVCCPMELVKSRLQLGSRSTTSVDCFKNIYNEKGIRGLYKGLGLTIAREVPAFGSYFFTYEILTRKIDDSPVSTINMLLAGGMAGVVSWTLSYPIDVIKTRIQVDTASRYLNGLDCFQQSVKSEGVACLFRGLSPTLLRAFPVNAVTFTVVTWTMKLWHEIDVSKKVRNADIVVANYADAVYRSFSLAECSLA
ncbi:mitochondrial basic amino acids transporter-like [Cylas formicarius]|uniref:mitochondrial basic amino acids transporter-like n=1 Tax=Cylas formicarius TaxID=197179 RepID=UPI00295887B8|nr:mitochondrial basic amino acids transporter-like [Cylas formicarius]XP_060529926.1 mitochondrial basic amino acids transporter-like [Cylas formicarius]XP_060529927.1 mitochondrial basic amino acids transporter-like [Cylas formicarius]